MFTPEQRVCLRSDLLTHAAADPRITGAAITGSAAAGAEDRWSDIDLAFAVRTPAELPNVLSDWTAHMYHRHLALHHLDVRAGEWIYRVFLLPSTLQVDLAFVPATEFRALAPTFRLMFGESKEPRHVPPPSPGDLVGLAWLYALHARTCIARGKVWQAEYMISGIRDNALALACIRHGLSAIHGRGMDLLPAGVAAQFEGALVRNLDTAELARAFRVAIHGLLSEMRSVDEELAERLRETLTDLIETPDTGATS
jgi:predicted nucleotidyltransferase